MLADAEDKPADKTSKSRIHRSTSKGNRSSAALASQQRYASPTKKRLEEFHLTKEDRKHQRFVNGLKKDIEVCLKQCVRESRFDSSVNHYPVIRRSQTMAQLAPHPRRKFDTLIVSTANNRQRSMEDFKRNELHRLTADVQSILTDPVMKSFYTRFIQPQPQHQASPRIHIRLLEESLLQADEQT